jgi:hypothetical protein
LRRVDDVSKNLLTLLGFLIDAYVDCSMHAERSGAMA